MVAPLDQILTSLGGDHGRFQLIATFFLWTNTFPLAFNNFAMVFYGIPPSHHCKISESETQYFLNESIPMSIKHPDKLDSCRMYEIPGNMSSGITECQYGYEYEGDPIKWSVSSEWDLVCDRKWLVSLSTSIYFVGVMLGGIIGGLCADTFGRRTVILVCIYCQFALGLCVAFVPWYIGFTILRFVQAIFLQALATVSFTNNMEFLRPRMRTLFGGFYSQAWTFAVIITAMVSLGLNYWRHVHLTLTVPSAVSLVYFWFIPESIRWLVSKKKLDEANSLCSKIGRFNGIKLDQEELKTNIDNMSKESSGNTQTYGITDLFRTKTIRRNTFVMCFVWVTAALIGYGVSYALPSLGSNVYASLAISASFDILVRLFTLVIIDRFGRKIPTIVTLFGSSVMCCSVPLILKFVTGDIGKHVSTVFALLGRSFIASCYTTIPIFTAELFPTVIRSLGMGSAIFASRVGAIIVPQLALLGDVVWKPFPYIVFAAFGATAGLLCMLIPDTHNKPMPDTIDDVENPKAKKDDEDMELNEKVELSNKSSPTGCPNEKSTEGEEGKKLLETESKPCQ